MALDYRKCAEEIAANTGGSSNVISAAHCTARLQLVIADNSRVNKEALENVDGVKGILESDGRLQLIIGAGTVNKVYDEFLAVTGAPAASKTDAKAAAASRMPLWKKFRKAPGDVCAPILPVVIRCGSGELRQPVEGRVIARVDIPDEVFAAGILGDGIGVEPTSGTVVAPFDGKVTSVFDTRHAVTLEKDGMEVLIHIGVNTVTMNGDGFTAYVAKGDDVTTGQRLLGFDSRKIRDAGLSDCVVMLLTNSDDLADVKCGLKK